MTATGTGFALDTGQAIGTISALRGVLQLTT